MIGNRASLLFLVALAATLTPKVIVRAAARNDVVRLRRDVSQALRRQGYAIESIGSSPDPLVRAKLGRCRLSVWDGSESRELSAVFAQEDTSLSRIGFEHDGRWTSTPPGLMSVIVNDAYQKIAGFGVILSHSASFAVARNTDCAPDTPRLNDISVWPTN